MFLLCCKASQLKYSRIMEVYQEELERTAQEEYGHLPLPQALTQAEQDFYAYLTDVFFSTENALCALWVVEDRYASAVRLEPYSDGLLVSGLVTAPECRRKGYAMALMQSVQRWLPQGSKLYAHVKKDNTASVRLHVKCGFQKEKAYARMLDGSILHNFWTFTYPK